jgi:hypothetical protein
LSDEAGGRGGEGEEATGDVEGVLVVVSIPS